MAVWGIYNESEKPELRRENLVRAASAALIALGLHLLLFKLMMFKTPAPFEVVEDFIAIELVTLPPMAQTVEASPEDPPDLTETPLAPSPPKIKPATITPPPAPSVTRDTPDILASTQRATAEDAGNTVPLSVPLSGRRARTSPAEQAANEQRIDDGLKSLAAELTCLKGFSEECAETRKDVFEEFQMTETDKVYTKKYAHTGMPAEFYGMSERQIREKLNLKFAGENGIVIIPGLIALDGDIWDAMHGVNKKCEWKIAAPAKGDAFARSGEGGSSGRLGAIKDCPDYLPAAKEDRDRRNKFQVRLKANEARREAEKVNK